MPLWQLTRAYSVFARDGEYCGIRLSPSEPLDCRRAIEAEYARSISDVLSNPAYKLGQFPLYGDLDFSDRYAAVKTGTSRNYRDTWAVGYTRHYIVGVWSGNKS